MCEAIYIHLLTRTKYRILCTVISPDTLPGGTVAAIVVVLLVVAVVTVGVFGTMISCSYKRKRKCLMLGLSNAADFRK